MICKTNIISFKINVQMDLMLREKKEVNVEADTEKTHGAPV